MCFPIEFIREIELRQDPCFGWKPIAIYRVEHLDPPIQESDRLLVMKQTIHVGSARLLVCAEIISAMIALLMGAHVGIDLLVC